MNKSVASQKFVLLSKFAYDDLLLKSNPTNSPNSSSLANTALKEIGQTDSEIVSKLSVTNALVGSPADLDSQLKTVSGGVEQADPGLSAVKSASELIIHELALAGLSGGKLERSRSILRIIEKSKDLHVDGDSWHLKIKDERNETTSVPLLDLLPVLQLPTKKN